MLAQRLDDLVGEHHLAYGLTWCLRCRLGLGFWCRLSWLRCYYSSYRITGLWTTRDHLDRRPIINEVTVLECPLLVTAEPTILALFGTLPVSYTHLRAHETGRNLVCRLLL